MPKTDSITNIRKVLEEKRHASLTESEEELKKRYDVAFTFWLDQKSKRKAALAIMDKFGVCQMTAYNYLGAAEKLYGNINEASKLMKRHIASEMSLSAYDIAKKSQDLDQMNKAIANYIKCNGLHIDDPDLPDFDSLKIPENPIYVTIESVEYLRDKVSSEKFSKLLSFLDKNGFLSPVEDIDHEDVTEDEE
jgi:hypothetical protein